MNENELLAAVSAALQRIPTGDGMTALEIADAMNISEDITHKALRWLAKTGNLECVRVWRTNITGASQRVPGYRLKTV